ncbi:hypothetical protein RRG08_009630 [Elysia crispata]|uniref:Uncharacterized protein n=1 Tax=Elysia crispata TaxID=231223 RepID=A0AAE1CMD5_9GAST|nr:hypothetical protein RRG08_009630 [Elysia crispata]
MIILILEDEGPKLHSAADITLLLFIVGQFAPKLVIDATDVEGSSGQEVKPSRDNSALREVYRWSRCSRLSTVIDDTDVEGSSGQEVGETTPPSERFTGGPGLVFTPDNSYRCHRCGGQLRTRS